MRTTNFALRLLAALGLAVDAYTHFDLAAQYAGNAATISQGTLFRIEAIVAVVVAVLVLITSMRLVSLLAFLVAASALAAVLLYRYADLGAIGPFPDMYEPNWYGEKLLSAAGEAVAALASLGALLMPRGAAAKDSTPARVQST